jgi:hypothetical protein
MPAVFACGLELRMCLAVPFVDRSTIEVPLAPRFRVRSIVGGGTRKTIRMETKHRALEDLSGTDFEHGVAQNRTQFF